MLAFRGVSGEPSCALRLLGVSPVSLIPQDKESFDSVTSHEENVIFHFRGVSHLALQSTCQRRESKAMPLNNNFLEKTMKKNL
jgi:hypothetical protein